MICKKKSIKIKNYFHKSYLFGKLINNSLYDKNESNTIAPLGCKELKIMPISSHITGLHHQLLRS